MQLHFRASEIVLVYKYSVTVFIKGFQGGSVVKNPPAMQETQVRSLSWEDSLEKEKAIHSSILAWEIPWMEKPGGLMSWGCKESDKT